MGNPRCAHRPLNPKVKQKPGYRTNLVGSPRKVRRYTTSYCQRNNLRDRFAKPVGKRRMPCDEFLVCDDAHGQRVEVSGGPATAVQEARKVITVSQQRPQSEHKARNNGQVERGPGPGFGPRLAQGFNELSVTPTAGGRICPPADRDKLPHNR